MQLILTAWYLLKKVEVADEVAMNCKMGVAVFANLILLIGVIASHFASSHREKLGFPAAMGSNPSSRTRQTGWGSCDGDDRASKYRCHLRVSDLKSKSNMWSIYVLSR